MAVPEISRFYGIVIHMFMEKGVPHHRPHFHAEYQGEWVSVAIDELQILAGRMPAPQWKLIKQWAQLHRPELTADWELMIAGSAPAAIEPLR